MRLRSLENKYKKMRLFTPKEDKFLWNNYMAIPAKRMAKMLNRCEGTARQRMKKLGITVPPEIIEKFKQGSYIKKGNVPLNKGKKLTDYVSQESIERMKGTQFKKGQLPQNTKTDLSISIRTDNRGVRNKFIRISLSKWIPLHRYNWEKENGKIPAKQKLIFKDGNTMNCEIDNLELLTSAELMRRNSFHNNYPKEICLAIQLQGVLNRQINKHLKKLA